MDAETTRLKDATIALKAEEKELRLTLREGASRIPLPELKTSAEALEQQKTGMEERLAKLKGGTLKPISLEEREKTKSEHRIWQKIAGARKKIRTEMWTMIAENVERDKVEETKEGLGLEF